MDNSVCAQASSSVSDTSNEDILSNGNEQPQGNNLFEVRDDLCEHSELNYEDSDNQEHVSHISEGRVELGGNAVEDTDSQEPSAQIERWEEQVSDNVVREWQWTTSDEFVQRRDDTEPNTDTDSQENTTDEWACDTVPNGVEERRNIQEASYAANDESEPRREAHDFPGQSDYVDNLEGNTVAETNRAESASELQQWQDQSSENEEGDWEHDVAEYTEWRDSPREDMDENQQQPAEFGWSQGNENIENSNLEEVPEEWHEEGGFQEAVQSWLEGPSDHDAVPATQVDTFYFPDDDNVYSMELRELLSRYKQNLPQAFALTHVDVFFLHMDSSFLFFRRRVSNLLHSGFRDSLDQLIQSYVERQGNAAIDWELGGSSPSPASVEQDLEQASANQSEAQGDAVIRSPVPLPSQPIPPPPPIWDQESQHDNWTQHDMVHHRFGIVYIRHLDAS